MCLIWSSLSFLDVSIKVFQHIWTILSCDLFEITFLHSSLTAAWSSSRAPSPARQRSVRLPPVAPWPQQVLCGALACFCRALSPEHHQGPCPCLSETWQSMVAEEPGHQGPGPDVMCSLSHGCRPSTGAEATPSCQGPWTARPCH